MTRIPTKPCKYCRHTKMSHAYNANYISGGEFNPSPTNPCQQKDCKCNNYDEMSYAEKIRIFYGDRK